MLRVNAKRGGVCIYYKISPSPKMKNIHFLQECIESKIKVIKINYLTSFHYTAHLANLKHKQFISNLETDLDSITVSNPFLNFGDSNM